MFSMRSVLLGTKPADVLICFAAILTLTIPASSQQGPQAISTAKQKQVQAQSELQRLKEGSFSMDAVNLFADEGVQEAIPGLEHQFAAGGMSDFDKAHIAEALVKLKDGNDRYWNYLEKTVNDLLDHPYPNPMGIDPKSNQWNGVSSEFSAWAQANHADPEQAFDDAVYIHPSYIALLGFSGDKRALPLLRRALLSPNYLIEARASQALARLQDEESVPKILEAADKAPKPAAEIIAEHLVSLSGTDAEAGVNKFVPKERANILREQVRIQKAQQQQK